MTLSEDHSKAAATVVTAWGGASERPARLSRRLCLHFTCNTSVNPHRAPGSMENWQYVTEMETTDECKEKEEGQFVVSTSRVNLP